MRKFKLIKEYPGSLKLNSEVVYSEKHQIYNYNGGNYFSELPKHQVENLPEYWQEIKEKKYEILSFIVTNAVNGLQLGDKVNRINSTHFTGTSSKSPNYGNLDENILLKSPFWSINSIKRLSDNEIFTVGDETEQGVIKSFVESQEGLHIGIAKTWNYLERLTKKNNMVLFTTVDKVKIMDNYKGNLYLVDKVTFDLKTGMIISMNDMLRTYSTSHLIFHSFENAKDFITRNKPCLSLREISQIYITANKYNPANENLQGQAEKIYKFVQQKLKL